MSRPPVSVVMPFAGDAEAAERAGRNLGSLQVQPGDELILVDNGATAPLELPDGIRVVRATDERSPAHARNAGVAEARGEWILFLDADCTPPPDLLDAYFREPVGERIGALAGEVLADVADEGIAARYGAHKNFLRQDVHLAHAYRPRAVAANLLVRRHAFEQLSGFFEGLRAAEDTDFSWRLSAAGWRIELRPDAAVRHTYRSSLAELRRQWRGYAAGRAWLSRRYAGFRPEPGLRRALRRLVRRRSAEPRVRPVEGRLETAPGRGGRLERGGFRALDLLLGLEEMVGLLQSNQPQGSRAAASSSLVLVVDSFPARGDPFVELALTLEGARVEARGRPELMRFDAGRRLDIRYREDDGKLARALALAAVLARHPWRCLRDSLDHDERQPRLIELAPAALRVMRAGDVRLRGLGAATQLTARRLSRLTGRPVAE